jgi:hypothetical protein
MLRARRGPRAVDEPVGQFLQIRCIHEKLIVARSPETSS